MIIKNINVYKLHDEFIQVGIKPYPVFILENGDGDFTFPDGTDMSAMQAVIDTHNPEPLPPIPTKLEKFKLEQAQADAELFEMMLMLKGGDF